MKMHLTNNKVLRKQIQEALYNNDYYCPCVFNSKNNPQYKCPCENFRLQVPIGESCHCGLYIKDED